MDGGHSVVVRLVPIPNAVFRDERQWKQNPLMEPRPRSRSRSRERPTTTPRSHRIPLPPPRTLGRPSPPPVDRRRPHDTLVVPRMATTPRQFCDSITASVLEGWRQQMESKTGVFPSANGEVFQTTFRNQPTIVKYRRSATDDETPKDHLYLEFLNFCVLEGLRPHHSLLATVDGYVGVKADGTHQCLTVEEVLRDRSLWTSRLLVDDAEQFLIMPKISGVTLKEACGTHGFLSTAPDWVLARTISFLAYMVQKFHGVFRHNDLHSSNIMVDPLGNDFVRDPPSKWKWVQIIDDGHLFYLPLSIKIIDFGRAWMGMKSRIDADQEHHLPSQLAAELRDAMRKNTTEPWMGIRQKTSTSLVDYRWVTATARLIRMIPHQTFLKEVEGGQMVVNYEKHEEATYGRQLQQTMDRQWPLPYTPDITQLVGPPILHEPLWSYRYQFQMNPKEAKKYHRPR